MKRMAIGWMAGMVLWAATAQAVTLNGLFTDGAVLQQGVPVPVWGTAEPGEEVVVAFAGQSTRTKAGADGRWLVRLAPLKASADPRELTATGRNAAAAARIAGVRVGEVWICSGQSNMQFGLAGAVGGPEAAKEPADPLLCLYKVPMIKSDAPLANVTSRWTSCETTNALPFTAVGYFFGRALRTARGVPVGLIQTAWGGTPAEAWTPREILAGNPDLAVLLSEQEKAVADWDPERTEAAYQKSLANWSNQMQKAKAASQALPRKPRKAESPATKPQRPCCLFNAMIHPLVPYAIRGTIWYQGESNSGRAKQYETLFPTMIGSWRQVWAQGDFPFLFVQIAPHRGMVPEIREAQLVSWEKTPKTAMAVITDVGEETDIHPKKKQPVGERLALAARAIAYGERLEYSGPVFRSMKVSGNRAVLEFDHVGGGLAAAEGGLQDFTIAPAGSTNFVPATASIEGKRIVVSSPEVPVPGAVRYGWATWFVGSLFNKEGLPATPFRTDRPE